MVMHDQPNGCGFRTVCACDHKMTKNNNNRSENEVWAYATAMIALRGRTVPEEAFSSSGCPHLFLYS